MAISQGDRIGTYRIVRKIGQGGMGEVYEVVHEHIKRRAAVKILRSEYSKNKDIVGRFFNEALAVNVIQHPSLVAVFEAGFLPAGSAYLIMEYVHGETLHARLQRLGPLPESQALLLCRQIASALAAAHAQDIIHRDLKTENVMLVRDPEVIGGLRAKVLDFGLAKVAVRHQVQIVMTREGITMGTQSYMAPEQWISAGTVDAKADVYALGVTLFAMLAGRYPFVGDSPKSYMNLHLYEPPPALQTICPQVSRETAALVALMLDKRRSARPEMQQISARLENFLAEHGVLSKLVPEISVPPEAGNELGSRTDLDAAPSGMLLSASDLEIE